MQNTTFIDTMKTLGFRHSYGPTGFEGIQARYNYRTTLNGCTEEEMFARLGQNTRRKVRIAMRKGVEIRVAGTEYLDDFVRIMRVTGERDGFAVRSKAYFERFLAAMGEHARLYMGFCEGQVVCGAIAVNFAKKCCYVYGASDNIFRDAMPNYLMQWEMMRWAIQTGCDTYDFQGVSGNLSEENNPLFGLYRFKRGFPGQVEELAGEFDAVYRPVLFAAVEKAAAAAKGLRRLRHRRREG
jgi:lipid II:glycine glycyltransferase (peptidoglycan interpeptide bridge formation enzyme)